MQFLAVYVREAHPLDGVLPERQSGRWLLGTPERQLFIEDPISFEERLSLAKRCDEELRLGFPMLVDGLNDAVSIVYAAWPDRLYLVDLDGRLIWRGEKGPEGFLPDELDEVLERAAGAWARGEPAGEQRARRKLQDKKTPRQARR